MNQDDWLSTHPYLRPIASLHTIVDAAIDSNCIATFAIPEWNDYASDFDVGVPLLHSASIKLDLTDAASMLVPVANTLSLHLPRKLAEQCRALASEISSHEDAPRRAIDWLLGRGIFPSERPGLLRFIGWSMLAHHFRPVFIAFGQWREDDCWYRSYCPTCGSLPAMAHLIGRDPAPRRVLVCGCCRSRWGYKRTVCPFCETINEPRVPVLTIAGEAGLRIDFCESCRAYLKTYVGEESEDVLLADWTSIHLDIAAGGRDLKRLAASLYQV